MLLDVGCTVCNAIACALTRASDGDLSHSLGGLLPAALLVIADLLAGPPGDSSGCRSVPGAPPLMAAAGSPPCVLARRALWGSGPASCTGRATPCGAVMIQSHKLSSTDAQLKLSAAITTSQHKDGIRQQS